MSSLLIYMVKVSVYLTAFYLVYSLFLSRDTTYGRNRAFLLLSLLAALIFPLITFQTVKPLDIQFFGKFLSEVFISASSEVYANQAAGSESPEALQIIYTIYITGVAVFLFKVLIDLLNILFLITRGRNRGSRIIRFHGFRTSGFSAMGYVFINTRLNPEEAGEIINHEQNHLKQNHFLDIIFIEIVKAVQWFNPVVYMVNRALRAIHEFQADQECLSSGMPVINYQSLLLNQVFKSKAFNLTNSFSNPSLIKKRMIMMTKKRTSALAGMKLLLVVPVTAIVFLAISAYKEIPANNSAIQPINEKVVLNSERIASDISSQSEPLPDRSANSAAAVPSAPRTTKPLTDKENIAAPPPPPPPPPDIRQTSVSEVVPESTELEEVPFVVVEEMPMFPGGDGALLKYIAENTIYPESAKNNKISGRIIVRFCVTAKGGISQISILKGVSPELDVEALRVVSTLPSFKPGLQGGKPVPVWYMVPITFTLK